MNRQDLHSRAGAIVVYELVETWRCAECGQRFRRKIPLSTPLGPPRGFALHTRACTRKARALEVAP